ncbi:suppressor of fused domain protein [Occultella gossypii]|uniref:Suppressor of fused domain protein n=1 Tax=Occultella gossypii TaxID=2800820 RepID=A0ABS7S5X4_9MICO|nr:suppressor of fused domain protein [Occultella gossypii]MBZ2195751.1 suppressor of fused domain protein [Occultella gossypii]
MIDGLVDHLEGTLGAIAAGWRTDPDGTPAPFQVVEFETGRIDDAVIYSTLGLSEYVLESPTADGHSHLELIMIAPEGLRGSALPFQLLDIGRLVVERRELPGLGTIIRNNRTLADLSTMDALYVGRPLYFTPEFATFSNGDRAVTIDWLLPVSQQEAAFVDANGWQAFEKLMYEREDLDPIDYNRASLLP